MCSTRSAIVAACGSWLTTIVVAPLLARELADQRVRRRRVRGVELARRLVRDQQARPVRERGGERDPLLLAARELGRIRVAPVGEADAFEQLVRAGMPLGARRSQQRRAAARRGRARAAPGASARE